MTAAEYRREANACLVFATVIEAMKSPTLKSEPLRELAETFWREADKMDAQATLARLHRMQQRAMERRHE